jgi:hypothetical protein
MASRLRIHFCNLNQNNSVRTSILSDRIAFSLLTATVTSLSLLAATNSAQAAVVQFTDLTSFETNATGLTNIYFEGLAPAGSFTNYGTTGLTTSGVSFTGSGNYLFVVDPAYSPSFYDWDSGAVLLGDKLGTITATLPSGVTAVGSDIMSFSDYASSFTITLSTGETVNLNSLDYPYRQFVGFTSDTAIASISFQATAGYTELDNFRFGTAAVAAKSVPEPFTVIGTLVGGTTALRMRKKLKSAQK